MTGLRINRGDVDRAVERGPICAMSLFMNLRWERFGPWALFPSALTLIGLAIVAAGIWWQRHAARLGAALRGRLPPGWRELLETRHEALRAGGEPS